MTSTISVKAETAWDGLQRELDCWARRGMTAKFWMRDDDACTVSSELEQLSALAKRHDINIGLAAIPAKLDRSLVQFLESEKASFYPMCHGWQHANYGPEGKLGGEFGPERPFSALYADAASAFETFAADFGQADVVFVPPFSRITDALVEKLPSLGFVGVSTGPSNLERRLARVMSHVAWTPPLPRWPAKVSVPRFDVHIDPIDWRRRTAREAASVGAEIVGYLRLRRTGLVSSESPIGIFTHHLVHTGAVWALCDELLSRLRRSDAVEFIHSSEVIDMGTKRGGVSAPAAARS